MSPNVDYEKGILHWAQKCIFSCVIGGHRSPGYFLKQSLEWEKKGNKHKMLDGRNSKCHTLKQGFNNGLGSQRSLKKDGKGRNLTLQKTKS